MERNISWLQQEKHSLLSSKHYFPQHRLHHLLKQGTYYKHLLDNGINMVSPDGIVVLQLQMYLVSTAQCIKNSLK